MDGSACNMDHVNSGIECGEVERRGYFVDGTFGDELALEVEDFCSRGGNAREFERSTGKKDSCRGCLVNGLDVVRLGIDVRIDFFNVEFVVAFYSLNFESD